MGRYVDHIKEGIMDPSGEPEIIFETPISFVVDEKFGNHKGYGLALMVEFLSSGLSLGSLSYDTYTKRGRITHFFAAIDPEMFGDTEIVKNYVETLIRKLKGAEKAKGRMESICTKNVKGMKNS